MLGDIEGGTRRHSVNCGMTPRVFEYLFSRIQKVRKITWWWWIIFSFSWLFAPCFLLAGEFSIFPSERNSYFCKVSLEAIKDVFLQCFVWKMKMIDPIKKFCMLLKFDLRPEAKNSHEELHMFCIHKHKAMHACQLWSQTQSAFSLITCSLLFAYVSL